MNNNDPHTVVDEILAMTDDERSSALCFIAGYSPEAVEAALKQTEWQRTYLAVNKAERLAARVTTALS
jgi:hypothetical protein